MLCYSLLEKRGDCIKKYINWNLYSDGKLVVENNNIECEYEENNFIKYVENNDTFNVVNLKDNEFTRENNDFIFKIDFKNNEFSYLLKEKNITLNDKLICNIIKEKDYIKLIYQLDEEEKELVIQIL